MNKPFLIFLLVLAMCLVYGCRGGEEALSEATETVGGAAADLAALQDMITKFDEAYNAGDVEGLVSFNYAEGAVRMPPSQSMMVGKAAILGWFRAHPRPEETQNTAADTGWPCMSDSQRGAGRSFAISGSMTSQSLQQKRLYSRAR